MRKVPHEVSRPMDDVFLPESSLVEIGMTGRSRSNFGQTADIRKNGVEMFVMPAIYD